MITLELPKVRHEEKQRGWPEARLVAAKTSTPVLRAHSDAAVVEMKEDALCHFKIPTFQHSVCRVDGKYLPFDLNH